MDTHSTVLGRVMPDLGNGPREYLSAEYQQKKKGVVIVLLWLG